MALTARDRAAELNVSLRQSAAGRRLGGRPSLPLAFDEIKSSKNKCFMVGIVAPLPCAHANNMWRFSRSHTAVYITTTKCWPQTRSHLV